MTSSKRRHIGIIRAIGLLFLVIATLKCASADNAMIVLTPQPGLTPKINGPRIYGARPGRPFVYRIPCTGRRPLRFSVEHLPESLRVDEQSGIVSGTAPARRGEYAMVLHAANESGSTDRAFKLVVGDVLALTPPMGWNDWYTFYDHITADVIRASAEAMIASGMADFGYQFVDIDDCWMRKPGAKDPELAGPERDPAGSILPNGRFPDMKGLAEHIHSLGLRAGIYTSPGPRTCGGFAGSYNHEQADAQQFADWGFDLLKYDWCSYGEVVPHPRMDDYQRPYRQMGEILGKLDRDLVFNLCEYGLGDVWNWGAEVSGNLWRTTGDVGATKGDQLPGFYRVGFANAEHFAAAGPGHWNDPDYILIGYVGNAFDSNQAPALTALTPDEQYSYMSMWSLMAAPLFYSGDMRRLDAFTLNVLCNAEVIDIDQDVLGKQATIVRHTTDQFVLAKPLDEGDLAVGLFNLATTKSKISVKWDELGLKDRYRLRDVWRQKDIGEHTRQFSAAVTPHGVVLIRLTRVP